MNLAENLAKICASSPNRSSLEFLFVFEERKQKHETQENLVGGVYNFLTNTIKVFLPSIASSFGFWIPGFMEMFKEEFIYEAEEHCIKIVKQTITHEYLHYSLGKTECPISKQHFAIEEMGY